jgi:6-phosphofructokinase 1
MNEEIPGKKTLLLNGSSGSAGLSNLVSNFAKLGPSFGLSVSAYISSIAELSRNPKDYSSIAQKLNSMDVECIAVFGGRGSAVILDEISAQVKKPICLVPLTVENDLWSCDQAIGFSSALDFAFRSYQGLANSDFLVLEVAGHESGFLALSVGMALGAQALVFPENPETADEITKKYKKFRNQSKKPFLVVVNEGIKPGRAFDLSEGMRKSYGLNPEVAILAPLQRHCAANADDVMLAAKFAAKTCEYLAQGKSGFMVGYAAGKFSPVNISSVAQELKKPSLGLLRLARELYL